MSNYSNIYYTIENINKAYQQGLSNSRYGVEKEIEIIKHNAYQDGRAQAYSELNKKLVITKQLQEEAWDEGYNSAIEDYLAQGDEFLGNKGCYEFGDCEHKPNKETQEAMQEVLDKVNKTESEYKQLEKELALVKKYPHYYKDIRHLNILDIYRFFDLFEVTDPCIQHSLKKMAVGGKRGSKDYEKDIKEAMDTLSRWEYMQEENKRADE